MSLNPDRYLSAPCYWTMICSQFFPYGGYKLAIDDEANAEMIEQIKESLHNAGEGEIPDEQPLTENDLMEQQEESKLEISQ